MGLQFLRVGIPASVISDMDALMRSLGGRTVPDGAVVLATKQYKSCFFQCIKIDSRVLSLDVIMPGQPLVLLKFSWKLMATVVVYF